MTFESIVGQEHPIRFLVRIIEKECIPHAFLFSGMDGIGKQKTAKAFGMALNCLNPADSGACGTCPSCRKVRSGSHPDIMTLEPQGAFIKIDQIRALARQLRFAPLEGRWRVVIINDAHCMNLEASNAILKMLEEPPRQTVIILTALQTSDLLPTIVSRCQQMTFRPIPYEKVAQVLVEERGLDEETALTLALCTRGSLGKALSTNAEKWTAWRADLLREMAALPSGSLEPALAFAETLAGDKGRLVDGLDIIMSWFRDVLMVSIAPERVINRDFLKEVTAAAQERSPGETLKQAEAVHRTQTFISKNANPRLALEVMMIHIVKPHRSRGEPRS